MCYCGNGCTGRESITDPRVKSERDAFVKWFDLHPSAAAANGWTDEMVAALRAGQPVQYVTSDDMLVNIDGGEGTRVKREHADPFEGDPIKKARHQEAVAYIASYTGRFNLILDLRANPKWGTKWFRLSERQVEVVLKSKEREAQWARDRAEAQRNDARLHDPQTGRDLTVLPYGRTYAAVDNESGGVTFLIFDRPKQSSNWHGWVFVKQQQGPNEVKLGAQRPGSTYVGQWPSLIDKVLDDRLAAVARYGRELGVCGACGLPLTNDESRREGIGPVCRSRIA